MVGKPPTLDDGVKPHVRNADLVSREPVYINEGFFLDYNAPAYSIPFTIHNNSTETFRPGDFKIAFICSKNLSSGFFINNVSEITAIRNYSPDTIKPAVITALPGSDQSINLPPIETLYPYDYAPCLLYLTYYNPEESEKIIIRLYTAYGTRDYTCFLDFKHN